MHPTHAVAPCLMLLGKRPAAVYGRGSGRVRKEVEAPYGCPFAFESALITLRDSDVAIEMARFLYHVARGYTESFNIYGERKSFEWQQLESELPVLFSMKLGANSRHILNDYGRGGLVTEERVAVPDYAARIWPSCRAAVTAAPTPIWCTSSSAAYWRTAIPSPATSTAPTGRAWASARINPPWKAACSRPCPCSNDRPSISGQPRLPSFAGARLPFFSRSESWGHPCALFFRQSAGTTRCGAASRCCHPGSAQGHPPVQTQRAAARSCSCRALPVCSGRRQRGPRAFSPGRRR